MNPILKTQFDTIKGQLDSLEGVLAENREDADQQHREKEDLLQEKWRQRKEVTTLQRISGEYDDLEAENTLYKAEREEIRVQLNDIVHLTKALRAAEKK